MSSSPSKFRLNPNAQEFKPEKTKDSYKLNIHAPEFYPFWYNPEEDETGNFSKPTPNNPTVDSAVEIQQGQSGQASTSTSQYYIEPHQQYYGYGYGYQYQGQEEDEWDDFVAENGCPQCQECQDITLQHEYYPDPPYPQAPSYRSVYPQYVQNYYYTAPGPYFGYRPCVSPYDVSPLGPPPFNRPANIHASIPGYSIRQLRKAPNGQPKSK